jgi:hypothetical protein
MWGKALFGTAAAAPLAGLVAPALAGDTAAADALFQKREDPTTLEAAIAAYEAAGTFTQAARACMQRLELHDDLEKDADARQRWIDRGLKAAAAALGVKDVHDALPRIAKQHVEALYWHNALYGRSIQLASIFSQAGMAKRFRLTCERLVALDGAIVHGGPFRMIGNFHAEAPGLMGGDNDKAIQELDRAVALAPDYYENRVIRARWLHAEIRKDRAAFRADLDYVLKGKDDVLPDVVPEQRRAKAAARKLLAEESTYF